MSAGELIVLRATVPHALPPQGIEALEPTADLDFFHRRGSGGRWTSWEIVGVRNAPDSAAPASNRRYRVEAIRDSS